MFETDSPCPEHGFTLIEVLIAAALLAIMSLGTVQLYGMVIHAGQTARAQTSTTILAAGKLEQLRSLAWGFEPLPDGPPVLRSDFSADLSVDPPRDGGPGLAASPPGTLAANIPYYVDYLDEQGRWVGNGPTVPAGATFIRRWSVQPLAGAPDRTVVLQVLVTTIRLERTRVAPWRARTWEECLLVGLLTRKGQ